MTSKTFGFYVLSVVIFAIIVFGFWRGVSVARRAQFESNCRGNIANIATQWRTYLRGNDGALPRILCAEDGTPNHSWRILLAKLNDPRRYADYRMSEPWDSENNLRFIAQIPAFLRCENERRERIAGETSYVAMVWSENAIQEAPENVRTTAEQSSEFVVAIVEMADSGIPWTAPNDLLSQSFDVKINQFEQNSPRSYDRGGPIIILENEKKGRRLPDSSESVTGASLLGHD